MKRFLRENGLSLALLVCFLGSWGGQAVAGHREQNDELARHHRPTVGFAEYLRSAHFLEATAENWESEFLQMFAYLWLTSFLFQKGSAESKRLDGPEEVDRDPRRGRHNQYTPRAVRRGGVALWLYERSLGIAFALMFLISFAAHAAGGAAEFNEDRRTHGEPALSVGEFVTTPRFWFESLQNWQSEFLAIGSMVVLSIFLRHRGSPESKPVDAPHSANA